MPTRRNTADERFARIDALMEEYRIRHEDLEKYVKRARERASESRRASRVAVALARRQYTHAKDR